MPVGTVVCALIYLQLYATYKVVFGDSNVEHAFVTYEFGLLDFHRELHWVEGSSIPLTSSASCMGYLMQRSSVAHDPGDCEWRADLARCRVRSSLCGHWPPVDRAGTFASGLAIAGVLFGSL